MHESTGNKYKMFRNFMANELGITKEEIRQWCIEAIQEETKKQVGQINIDKKASDAVAAAVREVVWGLRETITKEITQRLSISLKEKS